MKTYEQAIEYAVNATRRSFCMAVTFKGMKKLEGFLGLNPTALLTKIEAYIDVVAYVFGKNFSDVFDDYLSEFTDDEKDFQWS